MASSSGSHTASSDLGPFDYFVEVNGIKIVSLGSTGGQSSVDKQFTLKSARIVQELLSNKPAKIISNKQDELIAYMSANEVIQRVGVSSYAS